MSLRRCPQNGTPHLPHRVRLYFMGGIIPTRCPGEGVCLDHDRPLPCLECGTPTDREPPPDGGPDFRTVNR